MLLSVSFPCQDTEIPQPAWHDWKKHTQHLDNSAIVLKTFQLTITHKVITIYTQTNWEDDNGYHQGILVGFLEGNLGFQRKGKNGGSCSIKPSELS